MLLLVPGWLGAATLAPYGMGLLLAVPLLATGAAAWAPLLFFVTHDYRQRRSRQNAVR
jgi:hypothetical protein